MSLLPEHQHAPLPPPPPPAAPVLTSSADGGFVRSDGRRGGELRPLLIRGGVVSRAGGSAYVELGDVKVFAAVHGPRAIHGRDSTVSARGELRVGVKLGRFSREVRLRSVDKRDDGREEGKLAGLVEEALGAVVDLSAFPRSVVEVALEVVEAGSGVEEAVVMASSAALVDAGVACRDVVVAASGVVLRDEGAGGLVVVTDPSPLECSHALASLLLALPGHKANRLTPPLAPVLLLKLQGAINPTATARLVKGVALAAAARLPAFEPLRTDAHEPGEDSA